MTESKAIHRVEIDEGVFPNALNFSDTFNVAVPFIDRPVSEGDGERIAIRHPGGEISYRELSERVAQAGNTLLTLGVKPGERLILASKDEPVFFFAFWGAIKAGIIPIAVSTFLRDEEYRFLLDDSGAAAFLYSPSLAEQALPAAAAANELRLSLALTGPDSLLERMQGASTELEPAPTTAMTECFWLYSSGSTGNPKGIVHVHRDMVVTSERYGRRIAGITPDDTVFCASKLFFSFGFGGGMTFPFWNRATVVMYPERMTAEIALDILESSKATVFFGVPTLYGQMARILEDSPRKFPHLRRCMAAGEALTPAVFEAWKARTGVPILDGIGSTEVLHVFVCNRVDDIRVGSSGKPIPGYEVKVADDDGNELPQGEIGTLWVKGESNARCYWNNPEKTAHTMRGEWLNTGDMYYVDPDGYYVNSGRADDMLKVGAMWVSPIEVEAKLLEHPKVHEAAIIGRKDEHGMVKPAAFLVLRDPSHQTEETSEELKAFCKAQLAGFKYPRWFHFLPELPKTPTGKIQRFKLRDL